MSNKWYYNKNGQQQGPISDSELRKLANDGTLKTEDLVWKQGMDEWREAGSLKGLMPTESRKTPPPPPTNTRTVAKERADNEKFCESCGKPINEEAVICPNCGVKQKTAGIAGFFRKQISRVNTQIATAKKAINDEMQMETGISMPHKVIAVVVAVSAGWSGITGLGAIIAGRQKAGFAMLGLPLILGILTVCCLTATFFSAIASIFVVGIPFFIVFGSLSLVLLPLFGTTYISFYIADIMLCVKAK